MAHPEQQENLDRVAERIGHLVLAFCADVIWRCDGLFYMEELRTYVEAELGHHVAPDSPGRILRDLRRKKQIDYVVISRSKSLYEVTSLE